MWRSRTAGWKPWRSLMPRLHESSHILICGPFRNQNCPHDQFRTLSLGQPVLKGHDLGMCSWTRTRGVQQSGAEVNGVGQPRYLLFLVLKRGQYHNSVKWFEKGSEWPKLTKWFGRKFAQKSRKSAQKSAKSRKFKKCIEYFLWLHSVINIFGFCIVATLGQTDVRIRFVGVLPNTSQRVQDDMPTGTCFNKVGFAESNWRALTKAGTRLQTTQWGLLIYIYMFGWKKAPCFEYLSRLDEYGIILDTSTQPIQPRQIQLRNPGVRLLPYRLAWQKPRLCRLLRPWTFQARAPGSCWIVLTPCRILRHAGKGCGAKS